MDATRNCARLDRPDELGLDGQVENCGIEGGIPELPKGRNRNVTLVDEQEYDSKSREARIGICRFTELEDNFFFLCRALHPPVYTKNSHVIPTIAALNLIQSQQRHL